LEALREMRVLGNFALIPVGEKHLYFRIRLNQVISVESYALVGLGHLDQ